VINSGGAGKLFQGKTGIVRKPEKHKKRKSFRRKVPKNQNMSAEYPETGQRGKRQI
jgi:hypothetical protein